MQRAGTLRRASSRLIAAALVVSSALAAAPAAAQSAEELATARQTFNEGKDLEKKGAWSDALEKFKRVARVKMTPQVRFHIALCEENLGKLVSAMQGFELAAEDAKQVGSAAAEVAEKAPPRAAALKKRVARLTIDVVKRPPDAKVFLDDAPVPEDALAEEVPVDPGEHVVELRDKDGEAKFHQAVTLAEGGSEHVGISVEGPPPPPKPKPKAPAPPPSKLPAYMVGAGGVLVLVASGVFYGLRENAIGTVAESCKGPNYTRCDPGLKSTADSIPTYTTLSGVSLGVGLAAVATGGVLWFVLSPKKGEAAKSALEIAPTGSGVLVRGAF